MQPYREIWLNPVGIETTIETITQAVAPFTMVPRSGIELLIRAVKSIADQNIEGDFVECGVWQGGCAAAMKLAQLEFEPNKRRSLHLFDSFEGLPPVQEVDGPMASQWQQDKDGPIYYDNCTASIESVQKNFKALNLLDETVQFYRGWFETTVPAFAQKNTKKIAILRLDGDWYESTKICIEQLYPFVVNKGIVVIDDYYVWDGCALAIHEFLGVNRLNYRIRSLPDFSGAYFIKQPWRDV